MTVSLLATCRGESTEKNKQVGADAKGKKYVHHFWGHARPHLHAVARGDLGVICKENGCVSSHCSNASHYTSFTFHTMKCG